MELQSVVYEKAGAVATVRLNRPEVMNALDYSMQQDLAQVVEDLWADDAIRAVVLTGSGRAFSAGGDVNMLTTMAQDSTIKRRDGMQRSHQWLKRFITLEKPVITAVNGYAVGAGMSLALMGDIIIAADNAQFSPAFVRMGLVPDLAGLYFLPRLVGLARAKELAFTGQYLAAAEAERIGLVNHVVPAGELADHVQKLAMQLAQGPTRAMGLAKSVLNKSFEMHLEAVLELESYIQPTCVDTEDFREGTSSFLEKRPPQFKGR